MTKSTIQDVADQAGVSKATVSAVLNDRGTVRESTRERVLQVIRKLNYRPRPAARRRSSRGTTRNIGFLIKEVDNPYYAGVVAGAEEFLSERGYVVLIVTSQGDFASEQRITESLRLQKIAGLILTPVLDGAADLSHVFEIKRHNIPFVLLEEIRGIQANLVDVDNVAGAKQAVEYLIELGHTRIAHFAGPEYSLHSEERVDGVRAAYSESRLIFSKELIVQVGAGMEDGYRAGLEYFRARNGADRPTAVTCYNDLVALGLCRALAELEIRVPEDVSVIGYDDLPLLDYVPPGLTSVKVPTRQMGRIAAEILHSEIRKGSGGEPRKAYLEAELVIRNSTSSPSGGSRAMDARTLGGGR